MVITFIGSGGKTSLIWLLARNLVKEYQKILVTTTTNMYPPQPQAGQYDHYFMGLPPAGMEPQCGITLAGIYNESSGKLGSLVLAELGRLVPAYDLVLIEGDGSRELPLKAWADHEPVVPAFTDQTVGVIPLWPLGKAVSEQIVHRLPLFCALSGAQPGETLKTRHLVSVISGNKERPEYRSLFSSAQGKRVLFLNHREKTALTETCEDLFRQLPDNFASGLCKAACGNIHQGITNLTF